MLIRTHMEELKEITNSYLYEQYRTQKLASGEAIEKQDVKYGFDDIFWLITT